MFRLRPEDLATVFGPFGADVDGIGFCILVSAGIPLYGPATHLVLWRVPVVALGARVHTSQHHWQGTVSGVLCASNTVHCFRAEPPVRQGQEGVPQVMLDVDTRASEAWIRDNRNNTINARLRKSIVQAQREEAVASLAQGVLVERVESRCISAVQVFNLRPPHVRIEAWRRAYPRHA